MALTDEQRRHIRLGLAGLIEEADDADAAELARRAFVLATAIAPDIAVEELTTLLAGVRDVTELTVGPADADALAAAKFGRAVRRGSTDLPSSG